MELNLLLLIYLKEKYSHQYMSNIHIQLRQWKQTFARFMVIYAEYVMNVGILKRRRIQDL